MSKNNEYDIEKLFQKAAEEYPADFEEKDWQAMKKMLDQENEHIAAVKSRRPKRFFLYLAALLLLLSGGVYLVSSYYKEQHTQAAEPLLPSLPLVSENEVLQDEHRLVERNNAEESGKTDKIISDDEMAKKEQETGSSEERGVKKEEMTAKMSSTGTEKARTVEVDPERNTGRSGGGAIASDTDHEGKAESIADRSNDTTATLKEGDELSVQNENESVTSSEVQIKGSAPEEEKKESLQTSAEKENPANTAETADYKKNSSGSATEITDNNRDETGIKPDSVVESLVTEVTSWVADPPVIKKEDALIQASRLTITLAVGPDLSKMGLNKLTSPGYSYGLLVHYNFSPKWSVGIGALKSTKKYLGKGSEYHPPAGYWQAATNGEVPKRVSGECALWEIPLDVRYSVVRNNKNNIYLSGGVSSYFMLSESYDYSFDEPNPYSSQGWSSEEGGDRHLFNIINLSAGYERAIGQRFRVGVEPYAKIPIKGIGWAEVKFISLGSYITLSYNLFQVKQP